MHCCTVDLEASVAPYHQLRNGSEGLHNELPVCVSNGAILLKDIVQVPQLL